MTEFAVVLGLLFSLFCGTFTVIHSLRAGRMTLLDWSLLAIGGMYGLGWAVVVIVTQTGGNPTWERWINPFESLYPMHTVAALLLTVSMIGGWYLSAPLLRRSQPVRHYSDCDQNTRLWTHASWLMLILAVLIQWLYAQAYGGLIGMLDFSIAIRSALFNEVLDNRWSFLKPFGGLAMIAAYAFFGLWLEGRYKLGAIIGLVLSFVFSLYILYSWLGRLGLMVFLITFPLGAALARRRNPIKLILFAISTFAVTLVSTYGISLWFNIKAADNLLAFLTRELSFPFGSFFAQWSNGEHLFRFFRDFTVAPLYLLPSSWWINWIEPVNQVNTAVIMGAPKGEAGVTGGIPVDLLTLGLMQLHIFGIPIIGLMYGVSLRVLQSLTDRIPLIGIRGTFEAYIALKIAVTAVFYAQPNLVITGNFPLIVCAVIIVGMIRVRQFKLFPTTVVKRSFSPKTS